MFDLWLGDVELTPFILIFTIAFLPIQLLLCYKVKSKIVRLLPVLIFIISTIIFVFMVFNSEGWDTVGYLFLAVFTGFMLLMCGIGWGIWGIAQYKKKKNRTIDLFNSDKKDGGIT